MNKYIMTETGMLVVLLTINTLTVLLFAECFYQYNDSYDRV